MMNYGLLIGLCPMAGIAGFVVDAVICGFIQILYELRGESTINVNPIFAVLAFPLWAIIWLISYYILNNHF
jgi:hypothetical protein